MLEGVLAARALLSLRVKTGGPRVGAWIVCALCALVIIKPQEFVDALAGLPLLYVLFALAIVLIVVDTAWRKLRPAFSPHALYALAFLLWALLTTAVKRPDALADRVHVHAIVAAIFFSVAIGAGSSRGLKRLAATIAICAALVSAVAIAQGLSPRVCMMPSDPLDWEGRGELTPDDRPCVTDFDCRKPELARDVTYRCERPGPLRTSTQGDRVRYRGSLEDPNELSLMAAIALPFALALAGRPPGRPLASAVRAIPALALVAAVGIVVVLSRSRSGLIVYLVVLGLHCIQRFGAWGLVGGLLIGPPMLLLGGRSSVEAASSTDERVEILREGFEMIKETKGIGVGAGQFGDESSIGMTAHNAYVLAAAETGLIGLCLFGILLYVSVKAPLAVWLGDYRTSPTVKRLAPAVVVSLCGAIVGIFFLSWAYKDILYIVIGASAAVYQAARAEDERVSVSVSLREAMFVCAAMAALLALLHVLLRVHG